MKNKKISLTGILSLKSKGKGLQSRQAFTLVELIVVITILAILGTIAFISLSGYSASSRDSVRISDVSNMKTSLELFHLNAGKYPLPDGNETVSYSGEILWYQGTFGSTVVSQLSRNMSEIPTDPLTEKEYLFSTSNNKNEFQVLTLLEGELTQFPLTPFIKGGIAPKTNAATLKVIPKVDGNYNGVFIKTSKNIIPTPSIITSEDISAGGITLNNINIKSQVTNLGKNIPNIGNVNTATGKLLGLELKEILLPSKDATVTEKAAVITLIQEAYTGCTELSNDNIYEYILSINGETELSGVFDTVVLNNSIAVPTTNLNCEFNGNPVIHSNSVPAYQTATVAYGNTCITEQRTCTNGILSGSYTFSTCTPDGATGTFTLSQTSVTQGTPVTIANTCSTPPTSYSSSNTSVATIAGTTITTLSAGTTDITPTNGACADSASKTLTVTAPPITFLTNCTANGQIIYTDATGTEIGRVNNAGTTLSGTPSNLTCTGHIVVCNGSNAGYIIQACNAGATTLYTNQTFASATAVRNSTVNAWAGGLYQWGNKAEVSYSTATTPPTRPTCTTNSTFSQPTFITGNADWCSTQTDNVWGGTIGTNTDRQGPCPEYYHVPTQPEWVGINTAGGWGTTLGTNLSNTLKLPMAGYRHRSGASLYTQGTYGRYWSSSPNGSYGYLMYFNSTYITPSNNYDRAYGFSVRCFKN